MSIDFSKITTNKNEALKTSENINVTDNSLISFIKQTYLLFAASLMGGAVGAYLGIPLAKPISENFWLFVILEIGLLIGLMFNKNKQGLNYILLFSFVFMTGIVSSPLLAQTLSFSGGSTIIGNAFAMTATIVALMSYFAIKTEQDYRSFSKPMFYAVLVIIVFSLLNVFLFESSILSVIISAITVLVFTFMVVIDTQNIISRSYETPIDGAIALYLDFLNIFLSLINLLNASKE